MGSRATTRLIAWVGAGLLVAVSSAPAAAQVGGTGGTTGGTTGTGRTTTGTTTGTTGGTTTGGTTSGTTTGGTNGTSGSTTATTTTAAPTTVTLTPEVEFLILVEAVAAAEFLMEEMGLQFGNDLEAFLFLAMIYDSLYLQTLQQAAATGVVTGNVISTTGVGVSTLPGPGGQ